MRTSWESIHQWHWHDSGWETTPLSFALSTLWFSAIDGAITLQSPSPGHGSDGLLYVRIKEELWSVWPSAAHVCPCKSRPVSGENTSRTKSLVQKRIARVFAQSKRVWLQPSFWFKKGVTVLGSTDIFGYKQNRTTECLVQEGITEGQWSLNPERTTEYSIQIFWAFDSRKDNRTVGYWQQGPGIIIWFKDHRVIF